MTISKEEFMTGKLVLRLDDKTIVEQLMNWHTYISVSTKTIRETFDVPYSKALRIAKFVNGNK